MGNLRIQSSEMCSPIAFTFAEGTQIVEPPYAPEGLRRIRSSRCVDLGVVLVNLPSDLLLHEFGILCTISQHCY